MALDHWWSELASTLRQIPRRLRIILLVDANARFSAADEYGDISVAYPNNTAAEMFQGFLHEPELGASTLYDYLGYQVLTWISPNGKPACLDYVAVSLDIAHGLSTVGRFIGFQDCFDFDHQPLLVQLTWSSAVTTSTKQPKLDRAAMTTEQGKSKLAEIFATAPLAPWSATADEYLDALNGHMYREVHLWFSTHKALPRSPHVSECTWDIVMARRTARRVLHRCWKLQNKIILQWFIDAWKGRNEHLDSTSARCGRLDICIARQLTTIARLNASFRLSAQKDSAAGVRRIFQESREQGQSTFCSMMRSMLKIGRRYKPAKQSPVIIDNDGIHVGSQEAMPILARGFAKAERAILTPAEGLCHHAQQHDPRDIGNGQIPDNGLGLQFLAP